MNEKTRITELLQPYLNDGQIYVVDIQITGSYGDGQPGGRSKVLILLDSDVGITIEECASISRRLGVALEETDLFGGAAFILEVSSPGIDQPLRFPRQYIRNVGRQLTVTLIGGTVLKGKLDSVSDLSIVVDIEPIKKPKKQKKAMPTSGVPAQGTPVDDIPEPVGPTPIPFADIKHANVEISFK